MSTDQDDTFDPVDTENLLAQMSSGSLMSSGMVLDEDTDMVQLFAEPNLTSVEKARLLSQSEYEYHRSFLARELPPLLHQMNTLQAIIHVIPIIRNFSLDPMDTVRESLASQLDKIVLYFYQNSIIDHTIKETSTALDEFNHHLSGDIQGENDDEGDPSQNGQEPGPPPPLPHDIFTPVFLNLLLDQNADIAHQTRLAIVSVAENIPDNVMESEILHGVITGLERLYNPDLYGGLDNGLFASHRDEQDGEAELGKMLVVVLLTALATLLGPERCTTVVIPTLERFIGNSQFYVRKEIVMALGALVKVVNQTVTVERLVPLYDTFVQDDTWHIRRACCTILASLLSALPVDMKASKAEEIYDIFSVDVSRSVRSSIMEVLGEVIAGFEIEQVPESLLNHFLAMGHNPLSDHERAVMCAFSFPAVILTAGRSKWDVMKPVYMKLAGTFRTPIRRSLACSLHEVAKILGPELADRDLAVAFSDCLKAEDEVREGVLAHFIEFLTCLSPECRSESLQHLYRAWIDLERSSQWRTRDTLAGQLPGLCEIVDGKDILQVVMPLCVKVCTDTVAVVRESGVKSFTAFWEVSDQFGPIPIPSDADHKSDGLDFPTLDEEEEEQQLQRTGSQTPEVLFRQYDEDDVEMEDVTEDFEKISRAAVEIVAEQELESKGEQEKKPGHKDAVEPAMTTVKEQVIYQTTDFAVNGGFRSRVVAVQIIQSLLERGISVSDFEGHFLPILTDRLGVDSVANVRISVAKVVSWIVDGSYYGDQAVSPRIQELHAALQQDTDRDVRAYSGGPAELPKAKKIKKRALKNKKTTRTVTVFHQNPKNGELGVIQREENEDGTEVQVLFEGEDLMSDDNDENEDEDEGEDEDEDDDSDEDDSSDEEFKVGSYSLPLTLVGSRSKKALDSWGDMIDDEMEATTEGDNDSLIISESPDGSDDENDAVDGVVPSVVLHVNGTRPLDIEAGEPLDASSNSDESEPELELDSQDDIIDSFENNSADAEATFTPLSTTPIANSTATSTTPLSYADLVKNRDDTRTRAAVTLASNVSSLTSFCQANIPEPPCPTTNKTESVVSDDLGLNSLKSSPSKSGAKLQLTAAASSKKEPDFAVPLSPMFPSLSSSSSSTSSAACAHYSTSSASSSTPSSSSSAAAAAAAAAAASLPFSYASVVASGAAAAAAAATSSRAFSPPLSPPMAETAIALTF
ncbi:Serine/threonine-protein phosphatase 4 regulatory subunit 1 [Mortierella sp. AD032]|nr:Serine/threonine-protein phosphatase 4 regulatory subunit 1 [Mortierella sp. AD032]